MASPYVYESDKFDLLIGLPSKNDIFGVPVSISIEDWLTLTKTDNSSKFRRETGVLREQAIFMSGDNSCRLDLTILQTSDQIEALDNLMILQNIGLLGIPFSLIDNGIGGRRVKHVFPVTTLMSRPQKVFTDSGQGWNFNFESSWQAPPIYI